MMHVVLVYCAVGGPRGCYLAHIYPSNETVRMMQMHEIRRIAVLVIKEPTFLTLTHIYSSRH